MKFVTLMMAQSVFAGLVEVPWFEKLDFAENKVASDNANNSAMIMNMLRMYLSKFGLTEFIPQVEEMLSYGCWCQILKERLAGKGLPIDEYDSICRDWQHCTQCAELDFTDASEDKHCNASTRAYELSLNQETGRIVCDKTSDECGKHVCICDESLAFKLSQATEIFTREFNETKVHGSFDFDVECTAPIPTSTTPLFSTTVTIAQSTSSGNASGGNGNGAGNGNGFDNDSDADESSNDQSETGPDSEQTTVAPPTTPFIIKHKERQCCGEFPNRAPFHKSESRMCCGSTIIHTETHCCANGQPKFGSDPLCRM